MIKPLFVSHGAPSLVIDNCQARNFLSSYHDFFPTPKAILVISAHNTSEQPIISTAPTMTAHKDFWGFNNKIPITYETSGSSKLANNVRQLLQDANYNVLLKNRETLDHGAWVPLSLMYSNHNVPVVTLSLQPHRDAYYHYKLGEVLQPLIKNDVLILGSGSITHNLRILQMNDIHAAVPRHVQEFCDWILNKTEKHNIQELLSYTEFAPSLDENHPTHEHLLPFFIILGAAGGKLQRIHHSFTYGVLSMDSYSGI